MRYAIILLALLLTGCPSGDKAMPIVPVTRVTTSPLPEATGDVSYELEIVPIAEWSNYHETNVANTRQAIQNWLEKNKNRRIISIVSVPQSFHHNNYLTHLIIVSEPRK